jgi:7,8-dihydropterin-6-yl-methyl-4-(beta-D-ribofuranosyl)aminobenzene 5'-phosphate synthase
MSITRRDFLKGAGIAGVATLVPAIPPLIRKGYAAAPQKLDFGYCKSVKVTCISETAWFDPARMLKDIQDTGGAMVSSYAHPWTQTNIGGYAALLEVTQLDDSKHTILMDACWTQEWADYSFNKAGVDTLLEEKKIDVMVITHEHHDHYWGLKSVLKRYQNIPIVFPNTFYPEGKALMEGKYKNDVAMVENDIPATGERIELGPDKPYKLFDGVLVKMYDLPIMNRVRGEQNLYFNIKDKGILCVSGCCHMGIMNMLKWAERNIDGFKPYAAYGGLHIAAFENWDPKFDDIIRGVKRMNLEKLACNHCAGWVWAQKAHESGVPIVLGTDTYKSYKTLPVIGQGAKDNVFMRNGDVHLFG